MDRPSNALVHVVKRGNVDKVQRFLRKGVDLDRPNDEGDLVIVMSLSCGKTNVIGLLIDHSDGVNVKDKHGDRALIFAAQRRGVVVVVVVVVCLLLANGTDANEQNDFGLSALAIPVSSSSVSAAVTILDPSADVCETSHSRGQHS